MGAIVGFVPMLLFDSTICVEPLYGVPLMTIWYWFVRVSMSTRSRKAYEAPASAKALLVAVVSTEEPCWICVSPILCVPSPRSTMNAAAAAACTVRMQFQTMTRPTVATD